MECSWHSVQWGCVVASAKVKLFRFEKRAELDLCFVECQFQGSANLFWKGLDSKYPGLYGPQAWSPSDIHSYRGND